MIHYSVEPRDWIFVKGYGSLSFAINMGKSISKNLSGKYSHKIQDHTKQSTTDALKTVLKTAIQKTAEATGDLIGNKIADRIKKFSTILPQNNSERVTNKHDKEIPKEGRKTEERRKIVEDLWLM